MNECVILGNGPSLKDFDFKKLENIPTLGSNGIVKVFSPTFYFYVDATKEFFQYWKDDIIKATSQKKYILKDFSHEIPLSTPLNVNQVPGFSYNPLREVFGYFSVSTVMLQFAYFLGFHKVGLLGFDHSYKVPEKRKWHKASEDVNHLIDDYYPPNSFWKEPDLVKLESWYEFAKLNYMVNNRIVYNLSKESKLKAFPFYSLEGFIQNANKTWSQTWDEIS